MSSYFRCVRPTHDRLLDELPIRATLPLAARSSVTAWDGPYTDHRSRYDPPVRRSGDWRTESPRSSASAWAGRGSMPWCPRVSGLLRCPPPRSCEVSVVCRSRRGPSSRELVRHFPSLAEVRNAHLISPAHASRNARRELIRKSRERLALIPHCALAGIAMWHSPTRAQRTASPDWSCHPGGRALVPDDNW